MESKLIPLACGGHAMVDAADYDWLARYTWRSRCPAHAKSLYARATVDGKQVDMHRLIMGNPRRRQVDHIDRDGLNNCRSNLRVCVGSENHINRGKIRTINGKPPASRFKGVQTTSGNGRPWRAVIKLHGVRRVVGAFESEVAAARAYDAAALELHGEFAATNEMLNLY